LFSMSYFLLIFSSLASSLPPRSQPDISSARSLLQPCMRRSILIAALLLASPLLAQNADILYVPPGAPAVVYTPEIHIGSATQPSTITAPPVEQITPIPPEPYGSNAPPASTGLLATRHFDFIVAPMAEVLPGSMEDTSVSLGEYARQLRAQKQQAPLPVTPNAIAQPTNCK
jgi:hypothetical protein